MSAHNFRLINAIKVMQISFLDLVGISTRLVFEFSLHSEAQG